MKVFILMCHYGDKIDLTKKCIDSFLKNDSNFSKILIANNNKEKIKDSKLLNNKKISVINNGKNLGYGGGINSLIPEAIKQGATHLLFINNDCFIDRPILNKLIELSIEKNNKAIISLPVLHPSGSGELFDVGGKVSIFGTPYHREIDKLSSFKSIQMDFAGIVLVPIGIIKKIKGFDTNFFLYFEDVDFCLRGRKFGFNTYIVDNTFIYHGGSLTVGVESKRAVYHQTRSAIIYIKKYTKIFFVPFFIYSTIRRLISNYSNLNSAVIGFIDGISNKLNRNMVS